MSSAATWSTKTMPFIGIARAVVLLTGVLCIVHAALTLAQAGAAWTLPAYLCLALAGALVVVRLCRDAGRGVYELCWHAESGCFRLVGDPHDLTLTRAWRGPGWMALALARHSDPTRRLHVVVWKSSVSSPLWSELALRTLAVPPGVTATEIRKIHEPA